MNLFVLLVVVLKLVSRGKCNAQYTLVNLVLFNLAILLKLWLYDKFIL